MKWSQQTSNRHPCDKNNLGKLFSVASILSKFKTCDGGGLFLTLIPLFLVGACCHPILTGIIEDEVLYASAAQSWAGGNGLRVSVLPGDPLLTKYPPLYPVLLGIAIKLASLISPVLIPWAYVFVQLLLTGLLSWLLFGVWSRALGIPLLAQIALMLVFFTNCQTLMIFAAPMSEALFMVLSAAALFAFTPERIGRGQGGRMRLIGGSLCSGLAVLARSVGVGLIVGLGAYLLWKKQFRAVTALAISFLVAVGISQLFKVSLQGPQTDRRQSSCLEYYLSYRYHLSPYAHAWESSGAVGLIQRVGENIAANMRNGLASLGNVVFSVQNDSLSAPTDSDGWVPILGGLVILGGAGYGLYRKTSGRMLLCVLVSTLGILLVWTWPLTGRFWIPLYPPILWGLYFAFERLDRIGRWIFYALCTGSILLHFPLVIERVISARFPADWMTAAKNPEEPLAVREYAAHWEWLRKQSLQEPDLMILGGLNTLQKAVHFGVQGLWLDTLQHPVVMLDFYTGIASPSSLVENAPVQFARALEQFARENSPHPAYIISDFVLSKPLRVMLKQFACERPDFIQTVFQSESGNIIIYRLSRGDLSP